MTSGGIRRRLALWFSLREAVDARTYAVNGIALMALKYAIDAGAVFLATGRFWSPLDYLAPSYFARTAKLPLFSNWLHLGMAVWTLPFVWIGVSMSLRRAVDAGKSPWWSLLFFVPVANYLMMLTLSWLPSRPGTSRGRAALPAAAAGLRAAVLGIVVSAVGGVGLVAFCTLILRGYGLALFLGTPFLLGVVSAFVFNRGQARTTAATLQVVCLSLALVGGTLVLFALEGAICVAMALPPALALALMGGILGRTIALEAPGTTLYAVLAVLALPGLAATEAVGPPPVAREVSSAIEVEAPAETVWRHVVSFSELPEPPGWLFRLGVAYPMRAHIEGRGVGAIRRCEFSTGAFVEPITVWEEPRRLAFDVAAQPPPLTELSPYRDVHPPHLDGYFRSRRGEFRLIPLSAGRTRLEGSTWYELDMAPELYWRLWADGLVRAIHWRVLVHVKRLSERDGTEAR